MLNRQTENSALVGVAHGRFQVFHRDHLKYILAAKAQCRRLVVGITNPDPTLTREDSADRNRSSALANPLSYYERMLMVEATLLEAGLLHTEFLVTPLPINMPELFKYYVPLNATFFLTIYDAWGRRKQERLQSIGLRTVVLWERPETEKAIQGTDVRRLIAAGEPVGALLPPAVESLVIEWNLQERLRELAETVDTQDTDRTDLPQA